MYPMVHIGDCGVMGQGDTTTHLPTGAVMTGGKRHGQNETEQGRGTDMPAGYKNHLVACA
ncbi:hypothetical protein AA0614_2413 [Komagataeibacter saccharivorans NRIC 0614]|nr:hypothetical protein AA0614_2413 [Komagataeibacter saccharivorans NRIC 0614]